MIVFGQDLAINLFRPFKITGAQRPFGSVPRLFVVASGGEGHERRAQANDYCTRWAKPGLRMSLQKLKFHEPAYFKISPVFVDQSRRSSSSKSIPVSAANSRIRLSVSR